METQKYFYTWLKVLIIGIIAGIANNVVILPSVNFISGLYLDTIFTAAAAFSGGLISGLISAVLTTVMYGIEYFIENGTPYFWAYYLYMLCSIAVVLLVRLFARFFPAECESVRIIGGLISAGITVSTGVVDKSGPPETYFRLGFIRQGFSLTMSEILARFPVNIADKPIAVFGGYGIAFLVKKIVKLRGGYIKEPQAAQ